MVLEIESNIHINTSNINKITKKGKLQCELQFLPTYITFVIGFANIWRFPSLAYENGGVNFLIPYIILSITVGLPLLFMEFGVSQSTSLKLLEIYERITPIFKGIGWSMICILIFMIIYYMSLLSWVFFYIFEIVTGNLNSIVSCKNKWNSIYCVSAIDDYLCRNENGINHVYFNKSCYLVPDLISSSEFRYKLLKNVNLNGSLLNYGGEEYFYRKLLSYSGNFYNDSMIPNKEIFISYTLIYLLVFCIVFKGVKILRKIAFITSITSTAIMSLFLFYSLRLDGSNEGIYFFLYQKIDLSIIFATKTWKLASEQLFLSLSCCIGISIFLSSYNDKSHNIFKDSIILVVANNFMSILSSITTFSILGFMAKKLGKTIDNVANDGKTLMFVIYPEIASLSPMPMLFSLMFFIMILFLGIICIVWFISTITTSFLERFSKLKSLKNIVLCISTGFLYIVGIPVTTKAGIYYFEILNTFALSFNLIVIGGIECIGIMYFYGIRNFNSDINVMFEKNRNLFLKIFGSFKYLMSFFHMFINPLVLLGLTIIGIKEMLEKSYNYNDKQYHIILPTELICFGWFLCLLPLFLIVLGLLLEIWKKRDMSIMEIIKPNEKHITTLEQYKQSYLITFLDSFSRCWRRKKSIVRISVFSEDLVFSK